MRISMLRRTISTIGLLALPAMIAGCWAAAAGVGAETGYVASQENRSAGQTIDDQVITSSIKTRMVADPKISGLSINVDTYKGHVTLRGYLKDQAEIDRAVALAEHVDGVKSVTSRLNIY